MTALIFDCDGVLADTERHGHLPAFNETFRRYGLPAHWNEREYAEKLRIGGGKELMAGLFDEPGFEVPGSDVPFDRAELLRTWHRTKTEIFKRMVDEGRIPPRPGITRVIRDALDHGWTVAVASTSAVESVRAVLENAVGKGTAATIPVFAGDVVPAKKPDPAVYLLAVAELGLDPGDTLVVEDSRGGLLAAVAAGLTCVITVNDYTRREDFTGAALVVSDLGDPGRAPIEVLATRGPPPAGDFVTLADLRACLSA